MVAKGKQGNKVELSHNVLATTDQYHFILDYKVMLGEKDSAQVQPLLERLLESYGNTGSYKLKSISFDKAFYSALSKEKLSKVFEMVVMPRKGKPTKETIAESTNPKYQKLRNAHSGVNKVADKGLKGFHSYVGIGVLAYNLKRLGKLILEDKKSIKKKKSRSLSKAA